MNRLLLLVLICAMVQGLGISLTLLKSRLSDVTEISVQNMLDVHWLWANRLFVVGVVLIAVPWLMGTLMTAQIAKELSQGTQTAVVATLSAAIVGSVLFFVQFFVYQVLRNEAIPPIGLNRVWMNIVLIAAFSMGSSYLAYDTIHRIGSG
jgi:hypothetical protein